MVGFFIIIKRLIACVFSHNKPSLSLFKKLGFKKWGELPDVAEMDGSLYTLAIMCLKI